MAVNPFLAAPAAVFVARNVRITPAGETVLENPNNLVRVAGYLTSFLLPPVFAPQPPVVAVPYYSNEDFAQAFLNLLPQGRAWPKFPKSNLYQAIVPLMGSYARDSASQVGDDSSAWGNARRATDLLQDTIPSWAALGGGAVTEQLDVWNATLGLPDPCLGANPTINQQVQQAVARFIGVGGQSIQFFASYAAALGYTINISEYAPFRADIDKADTPLNGFEDFFVWQVNSLSNGGWLFEADLNTADEALGFFGNTVLQCEMERIAPAHTIILFTYASEIDNTVKLTSAKAVTAAGSITALADVNRNMPSALAVSAAGTMHHSP